MHETLQTMNALRSGMVMRYHAQPDIPCQSNAEHMWGVAVLMLKFYGVEISIEALAAALTHDCGEADVGDIPSPTKCKIPEIRELIKRLEHESLNELGFNFEADLHQSEKHALKICDVLEGLHYTAKHYHATGGAQGGQCLRNWVDLAKTLPLTRPQRDFIHVCLAGPSRRVVSW